MAFFKKTTLRYDSATNTYRMRASTLGDSMGLCAGEVRASIRLPHLLLSQLQSQHTDGKLWCCSSVSSTSPRQRFAPGRSSNGTRQPLAAGGRAMLFCGHPLLSSPARSPMVNGPSEGLLAH